MRWTEEAFYKELKKAGLYDAFFQDLLDEHVPIANGILKELYGKITPSNWRTVLRDTIQQNRNPVMVLILWSSCRTNSAVYQAFCDDIRNIYEVG